jgi:hypothetical protein
MGEKGREFRVNSVKPEGEYQWRAGNYMVEWYASLVFLWLSTFDS